jgi:hypothetical protein
VLRQVSYGADAIKFVATGGVLSNIKAGLDQQFTDDEIRSIIETTRPMRNASSAVNWRASLRTTRSPLIWLPGSARESATQKYDGIARESESRF